MISINSFVKKKQKNRILKKRRVRYSFLEENPQKKGICKKILIVSPKKPNSAKRKIAKIRIKFKNKIFLNFKSKDKKFGTMFVYIPGVSPHRLSAFSVVLFRGGRVRDLPGIRYKLIRGVYDFHAVLKRKTSRSKYGTRKP